MKLRNMNDKILFLKIKDPYGDFSNFSPHPVVINGKTYITTETFYQSQKYAGTEYEEVVRLTKGPRAAAKIGRDKNLPLRKDWDLIKENIMKEALLAKIDQHPKIKDLLLSTGNSIIVEHTENDNYWADGGDGSGKNRLGILWMEIREELRKNVK
jgi:ribA/ribD-fused uncharacterized protein